VAPGPAFVLLFHPEVEGDLRRLPANVAERALTAIERRLGTAPDRYGERLRQSLRGHWKLRVGDCRVVYAIAGREVRVLGVMHRKEVYRRIEGRLGRGWPGPG
jgi:mRNA-degrading endonuclease RelE of RelBE toxin-antitoxin system